MEKHGLLDVCPVCNAKNIHLLEDMCDSCHETMDNGVRWEDWDNAMNSNLMKFIDSYFMGGCYGKT